MWWENGIRMIDKYKLLGYCHLQVSGEIIGSPIFILKLSSNSRYLEVQLLADKYGNAVALNGRDCIVQCMHQKIIEEAPLVITVPVVWVQVSKATVSLEEPAGYAYAGTVEYLHIEVEQKVYFLE